MIIKKIIQKMTVKIKRLPLGAIWILSAIIFLVAVQILFRVPAQSEWLAAVWGADGFITFVGTVVLGFVAIYQNIKANNLNSNMQKLEEAKFISMVSISDFKTNYKDGKCMRHKNSDYENAESIDFVNLDVNSENLVIYVEFNNDSNYPIVAISSNVFNANSFSQSFYGVKATIDKSTYISKGGCKKYCFQIPFDHAMKINNALGIDGIDIKLFFENIFGYRTLATLKLHIDEKTITYNYRLAKFTDIKPVTEGNRK